MTERPISFSGPMVRALLDGTKTQTRRMVKTQPLSRFGLLQNAAREYWTDSGRVVRCPYGQPGDRLWVRETWRTAKDLDDLSPAKMANKAKAAGWDNPWCPIEYLADGHRDNWDHTWGEPGKTRVSIHMPRWASRLTLEVTEVRVERGPISEEDARAEGVVAVPFCKAGRPAGQEHAEAFEDLYESIYGAGSMAKWRWAISFRRLP